MDKTAKIHLVHTSSKTASLCGRYSALHILLSCGTARTLSQLELCPSQPIPLRALRRSLAKLTLDRLATGLAPYILHLFIIWTPGSSEHKSPNYSQDKDCFEAFPVPGYVAANYPQLTSLEDQGNVFNTQHECCILNNELDRLAGQNYSITFL